jgi:hypothetical protein
MKMGKEQESASGAKQGQTHVGLRIPDIALAAEKIVRGAAGEGGRPPFNQFVESANGEANGNDQKRDPFFSVYDVEAKKHFARDHRGDESLQEMPEPVVVIAREMECVPYPIEQWDLGVRIPPTHHEDRRVNRDQAIDQGRQREAAPRPKEDGNREDHREDLEPPRQAIRRGPSGPDEHAEDRKQEDHQHAVAFHPIPLRLCSRRRVQAMLACGGRFSATRWGEAS